MLPAFISSSGMRDIEDRIGIPHFDDLAIEWLKLSNEIAPLWAHYGSFGTFDDTRKSLVSTLEVAIRAQADVEGLKMTDAKATALSHSHETYVEYLTKAVNDRKRLYELESQKELLLHAMRRGEEAMRVHRKEAGLG